ncbi:MSI1 [Candida pseudojiufengensis]|uniref:MSI1 n=1 Tax=Candida pseudojiufengensis TaxID=497109 RepID=UPI00222459F9|nr:MSI1 [Candida pseudojiufengensis]KAI5966210.1 MSI1 [Candida pseudojiufengensis]
MDSEVIEVDDQPSEIPLIDEETEKKYRIWKKNSPYLYEYLSTNSLLWPSLTVQFFPDVTTQVTENKSSTDILLSRLLHGTYTLGQSVVDSISILQIPSFSSNLNQNLDISKLNFNQDKEEFEINKTLPKPKVLQKINQIGDVNKLKYMPQKPNVIASASSNGNLNIFERTRHKSFQKSIIDDVDVNKAEITIDGELEIFALDWNQNKEGLLLSGDMEGNIHLYDLTTYDKKKKMESFKSWKENTNINDIEWFPTHDSIFGAALEDGSFVIRDIRDGKEGQRISKQITTTTTDSPTSSINSISINPNFATGIATGDSNGLINLWDLRNLDSTIKEFKPHSSSITQLKFHPKFPQIIASSSTDHSVKLHNISRSKEEDPTFFQHLGHMLEVNDFDWSYADDWTLASVAADNSLHVWKPSKVDI